MGRTCSGFHFQFGFFKDSIVLFEVWFLKEKLIGRRREIQGAVLARSQPNMFEVQAFFGRFGRFKVRF